MAKGNNGGNNGRQRVEYLSEKDRQGIYRLEKERRRREKAERRNERTGRWDDEDEDEN